MKILFCLLLMTSLMYRQLITRLQAMTSLLGDLSYGFGHDGIVWYDFIYDLVADINGCVLIDTGDVIWLSTVGMLLGGTVNCAIRTFLRSGRGILYCIYWIFVSFSARKVAASYYLGCCIWSLSLRIKSISKWLVNSGSIMQARASTSATTRSGMWITLKWYPNSSCYQEKIMGIVSSN